MKKINLYLGDSKNISDLEVGKAGEYLVCANLIIQGYTAFLSGQGLHYDVVVDYKGKLIRIQVKTTKTKRAIPQRKTYTPVYYFNVRRMGKKGRKKYNNTDIDIVAFVVLESKQIGYLPINKVKSTVVLRSRKFNYRSTRDGIYIEDLDFKGALNEFKKD